MVAKESKLVNITAVKDGMLRLSFQMEACLPGTIPDPPLLAAALDLVSKNFQRILLYIYIYIPMKSAYLNETFLINFL